MVSRAYGVVSALAAGAVTATSLAPATASTGAESVASPYTRADPAGDVPYPKGDIAEIKVTNPSSEFDTVELRLRTLGAADPFTSTAWRTGNTKIVWSLYIDPGPTVDATIKVDNDGTGVVTTTLYKGGVPTSCPVGSPTFGYVGGNQFVVSIPKLCLDDDFPTTFSALRARVAFRFDPPQGVARTDLAPNTGSTPFVDAAI